MPYLYIWEGFVNASKQLPNLLSLWARDTLLHPRGAGECKLFSRFSE